LLTMGDIVTSQNIWDTVYVCSLSDTLKAVNMKITVYWNMTLCSLA
jgi:hypothetical protein